MDLNSEMSGLPVIQPAMITFLSLPTLQEQPIRNKCKNIQVSLFDNNQKITLTSRKWERKALKKENAYESEKFNSMKLQRTLQRAMFKSLPWLLEFYYANCNLFSSLFFFLEDDIFCLTTLLAGVSPSIFGKLPHCHLCYMGGTGCPCLTGHMCLYWCSRDAEQIQGRETGAEGEQSLLCGDWLWRHLCLTQRTAFSERE